MCKRKDRPSDGWIQDPGGFQGVFATMSGILKRLSLRRYHSKILLCPSLYRAKEKSVGDADVRLLAKERQKSDRVL